MDGHEGLDRPRLVGALDAYSASVILVFCQRPEDKMNRIPNELNESNVRQICSVLESLAKRPEISKEEIEALETATIALMAVNMGKATQRAYGQLSSAHNGNIPDELRAKLQSIGFDVDTVHRDYIADTQ